MIEVDATKLLERIDGMIKKIDHFKRVDLGNELSAWQTEDLHRNRPFTMRSRARGTATTKIRPHSLYEVEHSARAQMRYAQRMRRRTRRIGSIAITPSPLPMFRHWSTRPILRSEMIQRLIERMNTALAEKLKW